MISGLRKSSATWADSPATDEKAPDIPHGSRSNHRFTNSLFVIRGYYGDGSRLRIAKSTDGSQYCLCGEYPHDVLGTASDNPAT